MPPRSGLRLRDGLCVVQVERSITPIRVSAEIEIEGLDGPEMGVLGYPDFQLHQGSRIVE